MNITKGQVNQVIVTLYEKTSFDSPTYLFRFKSDETYRYSYCLAGTEISERLERYNHFEITETNSPNPLLSQINLSEGQYSYSAYALTEEQAGDLDFDSDSVDVTNYELVEGPCVCTVIDLTNNENTEYTASTTTNTVYE